MTAYMPMTLKVADGRLTGSRISPSPGVDRHPPQHSGEQRINSSMPSTAEHRSLPSSTSSDSPQVKTSEDPSGFFGSTSHPHVASPLDQPHPTPAEELEEPRIDVDASSPQLKYHLIQSFFKYQTLWVDVVDRETFLAHRSHGSPSR
jgi:hypothetical protein